METCGTGGVCDAFHLGHFDLEGFWGIQMKVLKLRAQETGFDGS